MSAVWVAGLVDVLMALAFYLPISTGVLFIVPISSMGMGAYGAAELAIHGTPTFVCIMAGAAFGFAFAVVGGLVVLRLKTWSGAIASLAVVEIVQVIFQKINAIGGAQGLYGVPLFTHLSTALIVVVPILVVLLVLEMTRTGNVVEAVRSDSLAADCAGISVNRVRMAVFAFSGALAGLAGALSTGFLGFVEPGSYGFAQINQFLLATILGGSTTAVGSLLGGVTVNGLPHVLGFLSSYTLLVFSLVVVAVMLVRPEGLISRRRVKRVIQGTLPLKQLRHRVDRGPAPAGRERPVLRGAEREIRTLTATSLSKSFGGADVLSAVDLEVHTGEVLGIIGANGAGKTTLVNVLTGVVRADSGSVAVGRGSGLRSIPRLRPRKAVRLGIARTFQNGRLYTGLTVGEHVSLLSGVDGRRLLELVGLNGREDEMAADMPYGDQRRLEIARALATKPDFLILDEPAAGMTRAEAAEVADLIRTLTADGVGVLLIDHNVDFVSGISGRLVAMDFGQVVVAGPPSTVLSDKRVIDAYLGSETGRLGVDSENVDAADVKSSEHDIASRTDSSL